jgi:hypothetical protein
MKTVQIKNRYTSEVIFECEVTDQQSGMAMRNALEKAIADNSDLRYANLSYADLRSANLSYADLRSADLRSANLSYADLRYANLSYADLRSADLRSADLRYANLSYANLRYANLSYADLRYAKFSETHTLIGDRPYFCIGPIGSRNDYVISWITDKGVVIKAGCFTGSIDEFSEAIKKTHGDSVYGKEYGMALLMIESNSVLWTPESE